MSKQESIMHAKDNDDPICIIVEHITSFSVRQSKVYFVLEGIQTSILTFNFSYNILLIFYKIFWIQIYRWNFWTLTTHIIK